DVIRLTISPKAGHTCDTTHVRLLIRGDDGRSSWDLAGDLTADPLAANPHPDRLGHPDVWRFQEVSDPAGSALTGAKGGALAWVLADPRADRAAVEAAAEAFQQGFDRVDAKSPFWVRSAADESALPPPAREEVAGLRQELDGLKKHTPPPVAYANGAQEGGVPGSPHAGVHDVRVHIRGSYSRLSGLVPRHFPVILA